MKKVLGIEAALLYLTSKAAVLTAQTKEQINKGQIEMVEDSVLHRYLGSAQTLGSTDSMVELLPSSNDKKYGISDFAGQKLEKNIVVSAVTFGYAATTATSAGAAEYQNARASVAAALQNSVLEIEQDGKPVISIPVRKLIAQAASVEVAGDTLQLQSFFLLKENVATKINLRTPATIDAGSGNKPAISVELHGFSTRTKFL